MSLKFLFYSVTYTSSIWKKQCRSMTCEEVISRKKNNRDLKFERKQSRGMINITPSTYKNNLIHVCALFAKT